MIKKKFTLIELITVIAILAILVSIVLPNISDQNEKAIASGIKSNVRALQTVVDMYAMDHYGKLPTKVQPTLGNPQPIDFEVLDKKYLKKQPTFWLTEKYWVDVFGTVWGSTIDAPTNIHDLGDVFAWEIEHANADYDVFAVQGYDESLTGSVNKIKMKTTHLESVSGVNGVYRHAKPEEYKDAAFLLSVYDKYGLPTAPVGPNYEGYPIYSGGPKPESGNTITFPLTEIGTYYITTNANGLAYWDGVQKSETKPEGTDIVYSFVTDDPGTRSPKKCGNFNSANFVPESEFYNLPRSQCMQVKIELLGTPDNAPTLHSLKILFHLDEEEVVEEEAENTQSPVKKTEKGVSIPDDQDQTRVENIIEFEKPEKVKNIEPVVTKPNNSKVKQTYQAEKDGDWTEETPFPSELPETQKIKVNTDLERDPKTKESPELDKIIVKIDPKPESKIEEPAPEPEPEEEWITINTLSLIFDAGDVGDWIGADITDVQPENTRIVYEYSTSNNESSWSTKTENINEVADSRYLKVDITLQKKNSATENPQFISIVVHYLDKDGNQKQAAKVGERKPVAVIAMNPSNNITPTTTITWSSANSYDPDGDAIVNEQWTGKASQYEEGVYTVTLRVQDSTGLWSDPTSVTFSVVDNTPTCARDGFECIMTASDLDKVRENLKGKFRLGANIDLSSYSNWDPIGNTVQTGGPFEGILDGNGFTISNLNINRPTEKYVGLFGYINGAKLINIKLNNVNVQGGDYTGAVVGTTGNTAGDASEIDNVTITNGTVQGGDYVGGVAGRFVGTINNTKNTNVSVTGENRVGGLVGEMNSNTSGGISLTNSSSNATVNGEGRVGGLVGDFNSDTTFSELDNSYATGPVVAPNADYVGGLVGYNGATITNSYATGNVTGDTHVGGLVGYTHEPIFNSYARGNVNGINRVGGLVGDNNADTTTTLLVKDSNYSGTVKGTGDYVGGFIGYHYSGIIENSYAIGNVEGQNYVGGFVGRSTSPIYKSYSTGDTKGKQNVGGFVGYLNDVVENSYARGKVEGTSRVGGFAGYFYTNMTKVTTKNVYHSGLVTGQSNVGGFVGDVYSSKTLDPISSYWDITTSGQTTSPKGTGLTSAQMSNPSNFVGWDFTTIWKMENGYPALR